MTWKIVIESSYCPFTTFRNHKKERVLKCAILLESGKSGKSSYCCEKNCLKKKEKWGLFDHP